MPKKKQNDIAKLSFEEALAELEKIVRRLEAGGQTLESSIEDYSRGTALRTHAEKKLSEAKLKVEKIVSAPEDGPVETEPFDVA